MGLHHQNNHGRVFHDVEARDLLKEHKRHMKRTGTSAHIALNNVQDSSNSGSSAHIALNNVGDSNKAAARPADAYQVKAVANSDDDDSGVQTVVSVVYQTVAADFTGSTAGYVTVTPSTTGSSFSTLSSASTTKVLTSTATLVPTSGTASSSSASSSTTQNNKDVFLNAPASAVSAYSATATSGATVAAGSPLSATHVSEAISNTSNGMSGGAKAGLACGILAAIALCAGLVFFCYRRKRNSSASQGEFNEKRASTASSFFGGKAMSEKRASTASQTPSAHAASTAPRLSLRPVTQFLPNIGENRKSSGAALDVAGATSDKPKSMWERRSNNTENPFADASVISEKDGRPVTPPANPFDEPEGRQDPKSASSPEAATSVQVGTAAAVAVAAAGTAGAISSTTKGSNNVHRVQLDFKPSMDDELELKSGQLVRVLHEYDDGWALCIRMDRTQQGVAPRTCLSKLPVKPRPQGPSAPGAQNVRPMTPTGSPGMVPRPLTPTQRERSGSTSTPAEAPTSVPARKPVPGQAL